MTRIRQWALAATLAVVLALSFSSVASADPGDPGHFSTKIKGSGGATYLDPGDPGH